MEISNTTRLYALSLKETRAWTFATLFIIGNIVVPQLCHAMIPHGGLIFLPIYFFTLIGAYKYGIKVGLLTAVMSPIVNSVFFDMPALAVLPAILIKSVLLASAAALAARKTRKVSIGALIAVVLGYQVLGSGFEWALNGNLMAAVADFRLGLPGMIIQVLGGWALLKYALTK